MIKKGDHCRGIKNRSSQIVAFELGSVEKNKIEDFGSIWARTSGKNRGGLNSAEIKILSWRGFRILKNLSPNLPYAKKTVYQIEPRGRLIG